MKIQKSDYYLIVDLEATCCDNRSIPRREMEIIEIGAVMLNRATWEIDAEFQEFIQPVRHPQLTNFCTELTSIRQQDVDQASQFPEVISRFKEWIYSFPNYIFCSWGEYDKKQFIQDCAFHNVSYPFTPEHINIKKEFSEYLGVSDKFGMAEALNQLGIELKGTHHRGIDDARNIASIYKHIQTKNVAND
jgi:inhibitor of KinA sporulation pathway (predicted exonuclease)